MDMTMFGSQKSHVWGCSMSMFHIPAPQSHIAYSYKFLKVLDAHSSLIV
jgi:hypothetical protein